MNMLTRLQRAANSNSISVMHLSKRDFILARDLGNSFYQDTTHVDMNRNTVQGTRKCLEDSINSTVSCFSARVFVNCPIRWRLFQTLKLYLIFCYYILNLVKKDTELICTPIKYLLKLFGYQHNASVILLLPMEAVWIKILKKKKHFY
jgi:hypothetical protein